MSAWCRERGLYPEQIRQWREACEQANDRDRTRNERLKQARKTDQQRIKALERELKKKEKVLAETAALLGAVKKRPRRSGGGDGEDA